MNRPRGFRADKCFEGNGPLVVFRVATAVPEVGTVKFHLVADASQRTFGVRAETKRTDDVKAGGALVNLLRKHARTAGIGRILREEGSGDIWIPLFTSPGEAPDYWVQLARSMPPEVRLVAPDGTALVRKSSQGTYTKRRSIERSLPSYPPADGRGMVDLTNALIDAAVAAMPKTPPEDAAEDSPETPEGEETAAPVGHTSSPAAVGGLGEGHTSSPAAVGRVGDLSDFVEMLDGARRLGMTNGPLAPETDGTLPEYQRAARDRLARRVKTVRKTVERLTREAAGATGWSETERLARLLEAHIDRVRDGDFELRLTEEETGGAAAVIPLDPERSPGQNLTDLFVAVKRGRRAAVALKDQAAKVGVELAEMEGDLARLRGAPLSAAAAGAILTRYRLAGDRQSPPGAARADQTSLPYREILWRDDGAGGERKVAILVGKSAADSDELCRQSKSNDYWFHVVGTTGSHVLIPARQLADAPAPALVRAAAILALHFSKLRGDLRGEVYFSRRQHIRKRKGMAPGLWSVEKAETLFLRYEEAELHRILGGAPP